MTKFLLPILALGIAAPALADQVATEKPISFERDGVRYAATVKTVGETMVIDGYEVATGKTFTLRVRKGAVSGTYGATPVNYMVNR